MKRIIVSLSIFITFLGLLTTASPYLLNLFGIDDSFKKYILSEIIDQSKGTVDVRNFQVGFGNLRLNDVILDFPKEKYKLSLNSINFSFNFWELLTQLKKPEKAIEAVYINAPQLILYASAPTSENISSKVRLNTEQIREIFGNLGKLTSIEKIKISDGEIIWLSSKQQDYSIIDNLNGWMMAKSFDEINIEARGTLFSTKKENIIINSTINFEQNYLSSSILVNGFDLTSSTYPFLPENILVADGQVNGAFYISNSKFNIDSTLIQGQLSINNFSLHYSDYPLSDFNFQVNIQDNNFTVSQAQGKFADAKATIDLSIENVLHPEAKLLMTIDSMAVNHFRSPFRNDLFKNTGINSQIMLEVKNGHSTADLKIWAEKLELGEKNYVKDFGARIFWQPGNIRFNQITGNYKNFLISAEGTYNLDQNTVQLELSGKHKFGHHIIFDRLSEKNLDLNLTLFYDVGNQMVRGLWNYLLAAEKDTLLVMQGEISSIDNNLLVSLLNSNRKNFSAQLEIGDYLHSPAVKNATLTNLPIVDFTTNQLLINLFKRFAIDLQLNGTMSELAGTIELVDNVNHKDYFKLNTVISNIFDRQRQFTGQILLKDMRGDYNFKQSIDFLDGEFNFSDAIMGSLSINLKNQEQLSGKMNFNKFKFYSLIDDSLSDADIKSLAEINGTIILGGLISKPQLKADLTAEKLVLNDIGYYQTELHLTASNESVFMDSLVLYLNNLPIVQGHLDYSVTNQSLTGELFGKDIDLEPISGTISPANQMKGFANYQFSLGGSLNKPTIHGSIQINNGEIYDIPFDKFGVILSDSIKSSGKFFNFQDHILCFKNLEFTDLGKFHLAGEGSIPVDKTDSLSVRGHFNGDILSFIPRLTPFFLDGTSNSSMSFELTGSMNRPRLKSGHIDMERGELWLAKVAPHIENMHGRIELKEGTNQVNFVDFKASVDDAILTINTVRDIIVNNGEKLENWYFKGTDLDFGILSLKTSERGVSVNIPGLMDENETGQLKLSAITGEESFYYAGPAKHPRARGTVTLYNTRFTFPFIINETPAYKPSIVVEFLENMYWDILVQSGEDVVYHREIPAYFDKVYTEVFIDETSAGIYFKGILKDGTFHPTGQATSSRGRLEYLDTNFRVERFAVEFTPSDLLPYVSGRAWTAMRDSVGGVPKTIYLELYALDPETGEEKQQGSWDDFKFKLVSADPQLGETQEQVLAYLGFSVGNIKEKATSVGGAVTERYLIRPFLRPLERALEKNLGIDLVRINSNIAKNLFFGSLGSEFRDKPFINPFATNAPYLYFMQSSELTLGKYLSQNLYLTYTGQLVSFYDQSETSFDINHSLGIEYRFLRNVLLEFEYDRELLGYFRIPNQKQYLEDFKIRLRHSIAF